MDGVSCGFFFSFDRVAILKLLVHAKDCLLDSESLKRGKERKTNKSKDGVDIHD